MKNQKIVPTTGTIKVTESRTCDICHAVGYGGDDWAERSGETRVTNISYRYGDDVWHDSSDLREDSFDICPKCWKDKLVPWMTTFGATPHTEDMSY